MLMILKYRNFSIKRLEHVKNLVEFYKESGFKSLTFFCANICQMVINQFLG